MLKLRVASSFLAEINWCLISRSKAWTISRWWLDYLLILTKREWEVASMRRESDAPAAITIRFQEFNTDVPRDSGLTLFPRKQLIPDIMIPHSLLFVVVHAFVISNGKLTQCPGSADDIALDNAIKQTVDNNRLLPPPYEIILAHEWKVEKNEWEANWISGLALTDLYSKCFLHTHNNWLTFPSISAVSLISVWPSETITELTKAVISSGT